MEELDLFREGLIFFNAGQYFEAHEVWEDVWRSTAKGPLRNFYQGLIQAAVGLHHLHRGNTAGARSQLTKSIENLGGGAAEDLGIDAESLIAELNRVRREMRSEKVQIRAR